MWISWCSAAISRTCARSTVKRPSPFAKVSTWPARRRVCTPRRHARSSFAGVLINGIHYYGDGSNGRVNGPRHLTPCNELGPAMGGALFVPFRHDHVAKSFRTSPVAAAFLVAIVVDTRRRSGNSIAGECRGAFKTVYGPLAIDCCKRLASTRGNPFFIVLLLADQLISFVYNTLGWLDSLMLPSTLPSFISTRILWFYV